jgi:molybdate transport system ATP-binding protein
VSTLSFQCRHRFDSGFELDIAFDTDDPVTSLFGPSGAGKTTVLSMIGGLLRPRQGQIRLGSRVLVDTSRGVCLPAERRSIGFVFQDHLLFPHLSVEANLRYGLRRRVSGAIDFRRVVEVLELGGLLRRYPQTLSGGERQRVALGRALLSGPELLLMDEPLAALDAALSSRILTHLERVVREWNVPTLFVSHGQAEVRRLAGRVIVIEQGRVVACGTPEEALSHARPLAWKDSAAPANLLRIEQVVRRDGHRIGRIGDQELHLVPGEPDDTPLFVQFSPSEVTLSRQDVSGLSIRNHLRGQVRQVITLPEGVFVAIDIGQVFWAKVMHQAAAELDLCPGTTVTCLIKTQSLRVFS